MFSDPASMPAIDRVMTTLSTSKHFLWFVCIYLIL